MDLKNVLLMVWSRDNIKNNSPPPLPQKRKNWHIAVYMGLQKLIFKEITLLKC